MSTGADAEDRREAIADADAVFGTHLISGDACRVGFERQNDQVEHGADVIGRPARRDIEIDSRAIDLRQRPAEPFLRALEPAFDFAKRLQKFVEPLLIGPAEVLRSEREFQKKIDTRPEARSGGSPLVGGSKPFKDATRHRLSGISAQSQTRSWSIGSGADAALARKTRRRNARWAA